ncbi:rhodanese-related sulfurtransferase [Glaciibacter superstes]|uniref:oxygen-dependent tRNA uridine(34) hydroxylase TrhO n=1 Tax=Glaciibacter superstes TaxID=501023 RepID=UPI0003B580C5|nr:rhodanese-related sulfurtransferase [Glaciibacter superstes]
MAIPKILLYYVFTPLADPEAVRLWQRDLCEGLGLRGRILISKDGLNGTVGGELNAVKRYLRKTRDYAPFKNLDVKWSEGTGLDDDGQSLDFPRLVVKVRDEIVSFGAPGELQVDADGVVGGGAKLAPAELHDLVAERGDDVVFFDGRNAFEAEIGRFKNAVVPDVANTREFVAELDSGKYDHLKDKPVVTYCTGGIRCEVLSGLMKARGFDEVYQLDGGIARYGEAFGDDGLWNGSLYVFDQRMSVDFSNHAAVIGQCQVCGDATKNMLNCRDLSCREQLVVCQGCVAQATPACAVHATDVANSGDSGQSLPAAAESRGLAAP